MKSFPIHFGLWNRIKKRNFIAHDVKFYCKLILFHLMKYSSNREMNCLVSTDIIQSKYPNDIQYMRQRLCLRIYFQTILCQYIILTYWKESVQNCSCQVFCYVCICCSLVHECTQFINCMIGSRLGRLIDELD